MIKSEFLLFFVATLAISMPSIAEKSSRWQSPLTVEGTETISLEQARVLYEKAALFVDVRSPRQYNKRHIPGSISLYVKNSFSEARLLKHADKDEPIVLYCNGAHCSLSYKAAEKAVSWGFSQIKYYRDGFRAWRLAGHPLEYGPRPLMKSIQ